MTLISTYDVLCGKDKTYENHVGNRLYRELVVNAAPKYTAAISKQEKMQMTRDIVSSLTLQYGSRFMKVSSVHGGWEEINMAAARDKTSHALRFCAAHMEASLYVPSSKSKRRKMSKKKNQSTNSHINKPDRNVIRRKISFDEMKRSKCISPCTPDRPISFHFRDNFAVTGTSSCNDELRNESVVTWSIPDETPSAVHDLSTEIDYCDHAQQQNQKTILPFSTSSSIDIDTLWSYQLDGDDEFVLNFEE